MGPADGPTPIFFDGFDYPPPHELQEFQSGKSSKPIFRNS